VSGRLAALAAILCLSFSLLPAQHPSKSAALKRYRPPEAPALVRPYDETARLWQEFMLVRNANGGDAEAQHELGLRHLFGEGFPADTAKAALWIARAAAQRLPTAAFNYGILLNNGWGVPWNPFAAYANFEFAASRGVADAEYAFGLFLLDNLAVPRDEREARCWIKAAADSAYLPAVELLGVLDARSSGAEPRAEERKSRKEASAGRFGLVFLDFNQDTSAHVSDEMLVEDLAASPADS
jgi:TPR repeat protein